jgi:prephenate dehydratase
MQVTVGFQGVVGAFSEEAVRSLLGEVACRGYGSFDELVAAVDREEVTCGLLPVENTLYGAIARSYDLLSEYANVRVVDETSLRISQCLVGLEGAAIDEVDQVFSHPVALEQCRRFLNRMRSARPVIECDTAAAVAGIVRRGNPREAAIGSHAAAKRYGASVLAAEIQDDPENYTRFFLIERNGRPRCSPKKACVALKLPHEPGSLRDALDILAGAGCNLTTLVARPDRQNPFNYLFYAEFSSDGTVPPLDVMNAFGDRARLLGAY